MIRSFVLAFALLSTFVAAGQDSHHSVPRASESPSTPAWRQLGDQHSVIIATAAAPAHLSDEAYRDLLSSQFRQLEPENAMKFGPIHPRAGNDAASYDFTAADQLVLFAQAHNMLVRGHCFVWHQQVARWVNDGVKKGVYGPGDLRNILQSHIATVAHRYAGKVWAWDVVNEAFDDQGAVRSTVWYDAPGIGYAGKGTAYVEQAFRWANEADPAAKLFYNDYDAEVINKKSDAILAMFHDFKNRGVPIDGIGFQMHINTRFGDPKNLQSFAANLKRFSDAGAEIHLTELDVALDDDTSASLATQADLYGHVIEICLRTPKCKVIQFWGFTDKYSWIPSQSKGKQGWALPFDTNYNKKPAYFGITRALQRK